LLLALLLEAEVVLVVVLWDLLVIDLPKLERTTLAVVDSCRVSEKY